MFLLVHNLWPQRAIVAAVAALVFCAAALPTTRAEAAFVGVGLPGYYYAAAPACAYYYPYGCYGYAAPYYAPAAVVVGGWGWRGPCWGCGRFFRDGRFFDRDGRFFHDDRFSHAGFGGPGFARGGFGGPGMMRGGFGGGRR